MQSFGCVGAAFSTADQSIIDGGLSISAYASLGSSLSAEGVTFLGGGISVLDFWSFGEQHESGHILKLKQISEVPCLREERFVAANLCRHSLMQQCAELFQYGTVQQSIELSVGRVSNVGNSLTILRDIFAVAVSCMERELVHENIRHDTALSRCDAAIGTA